MDDSLFAGMLRDAARFEQEMIHWFEQREVLRYGICKTVGKKKFGIVAGGHKA